MRPFANSSLTLSSNMRIVTIVSYRRSKVALSSCIVSSLFLPDNIIRLSTHDALHTKTVVPAPTIVTQQPSTKKITHDGSRYTKILMLFSVPGKKERCNGPISVSETYLRPPSEEKGLMITNSSDQNCTTNLFNNRVFYRQGYRAAHH